MNGKSFFQFIEIFFVMSLYWSFEQLKPLEGTKRDLRRRWGPKPKIHACVAWTLIVYSVKIISLKVKPSTKGFNSCHQPTKAVPVA
jgi:hypothetical protein